MVFLYKFVSQLFYPTSLALICLLACLCFKKFQKVSRACFWLAVGILFICGNGWITGGLTKHLEWQHLPPDPVPKADCIVILSGCTLPQLPPRPTVEVGDAGDRVLYAAHLYRQGKAPRIICTGGFSVGSIALRSASEDMAEYLEALGIPKEAVILETKAHNTHEHAVQLYPMLKQNGYKRVLLVTSAMHMPRSVGVFHRSCPDLELIPAPTDFHITQGIEKPWYYSLMGFIPMPRNIELFSAVMHEYVGIAYYKLRGWI